MRSLTDLLIQHPIWSLSKASIVYPIMATELSLVRAHVNFNMCDNISALIGLLTGGAGIGMLPEVLITEQLEKGDLVRLGRWNTGTLLPFFVTWRCDEKQVAVRKLVELAFDRSAEAGTISLEVRRKRPAGGRGDRYFAVAQSHAGAGLSAWPGGHGAALAKALNKNRREYKTTDQ